MLDEKHTRLCGWKRVSKVEGFQELSSSKSRHSEALPATILTGDRKTIAKQPVQCEPANENAPHDAHFVLQDTPEHGLELDATSVQHKPAQENPQSRIGERVALAASSLG